MSLMSNKIILFILITIVNYIKNELSIKSTYNSLRFLYNNIQETENNQNEENYKKTNYDYFFNSIRFMNPLNIFSETNNSTDEGFKVRCFWVDTKTYRVFDLSQLKSKNAQGYIFPTPSYNYTLNFCEDLSVKCNSLSTQMIAINNQDKKCMRLAGSIVANNNTWSLIDKENPDYGINILLNEGENSTLIPGNPQYRVNLIAKCNPNLTETIKWGEIELDVNKSPNSITFESKEVCPKANFYEVMKVLTDNFWIFGITMVLLGLFLNFLGSKFIIITIFIFTCILTIIFFFILMFQFILPSGAKQEIVWVVLFISIVLGIILGYFVAKYKNTLLSIIIGSYTGFVFGNLLFNIALKYVKANPDLVLWLTIIVSIALFIFICYKLIDHFIIFATSLNGSYLIIRGISLFANGFPSETLIIDLIKKEEFETLKSLLTPIVYIYIVCWMILSILGMWVQCKTRTEEDKQKLDDNYKYFSGK